MRLLDKIALNRLIKIITDFILGILKLFKPKDTDILDTPKKRPIIDLIRRWIK